MLNHYDQKKAIIKLLLNPLLELLEILEFLKVLCIMGGKPKLAVKNRQFKQVLVTLILIPFVAADLVLCLEAR